jgi:TolA-binding protein
LKTRSGIGLLSRLSALAAVLVLFGCAYFNTFYTAKKNFNQAEKMYLRPDARPTPQQVQLYDQALRGATKVVVNYPDSKWVDDAVLMMGRSLIGKGDYPAARLKFEELEENFPDSPFLDQGLYYTGETYRKNREWDASMIMYDSLLIRFPKSDMVRPANLQRGKVFSEKRQPRQAIAVLLPSANRGGNLELQARLALGNSYFELEVYDSAATQFRWVGRKVKSEELINEAVMREGECLEALGEYDKALRLYSDWDRRARTLNYQDQAKIRRGYTMALSGDVDGGIDALERLIAERRRSPMAAQALFQIGYIQEVLLDDFDAARATYARVPEESQASAFAQQAITRSENLGKIETLRASLDADTTGVEAAAAAAFTVAEHYLFSTDNPTRALAEYRKVEEDYPESQYAPKAAFAGAWVLARELEEPEAADSAFWHVADTYPDTEFGQAASAFVRGQVDSLRSSDPLEPTLVSYPLTPGALPYVKPQPRLELGGAAGASRQLAEARRDSAAMADSLQRMARRNTGLTTVAPAAALVDSTGGPADSLAAIADSSAVPPDTSGVAQEEAPSDTSGTTNSEAPPDTTQNVPESDARRDTSSSPGN